MKVIKGLRALQQPARVIIPTPKDLYKQFGERYPNAGQTDYQSTDVDTFSDPEKIGATKNEQHSAMVNNVANAVSTGWEAFKKNEGLSDEEKLGVNL